MSKLVLIDGNAILHRAYHALPPLTTKRGEPINAVYGFISMLLRIIQDLKPRHIAVAFDRKEPTFRHKEFKAYQAQRPEMDRELSSQFDKARDVITSFGIPIYDKVGYEADDVIGTLARKAVLGKWEVGDEKLDKEVGSGKKSHISRRRRTSHIQPRTSIQEVVIVTGDRDILQLVTDKVKIYMPVLGMSQGKLMGKDEVIEKMGVPPEQIADYKALVGDPSDNYPGVSGIGPKTATKLLSKYQSLEGIYKNIDKLEAPVVTKLKDGKESAKISQKLARIVIDVPFKFEIEKMGKWKVNSKKVLDLFAEYGFKTLTKRVKDVGVQIEKEAQMTLLE